MSLHAQYHKRVKYFLFILCHNISLYEMFTKKSQPFQFFLGLIKKKKSVARCVAVSILSDSLHMSRCIYSAGIECSLVVLTETDPAQHAFVAAFCHIVIMKEPMFCKEIRGRH